MVIYKPQVSTKEGSTFHSTEFEMNGSRQCLWYSVQPDYHEWFDQSTNDAALLALLPLAMLMNEKICLKGSLSSRLYYNITNYFISILTKQIRRLNEVEIEPTRLVSNNENQEGQAVVTGFSAGVDSFCALHDHNFVAQSINDFKITHLLFNNVGSHNDSTGRVFRERYSRVTIVAKEMGIPILKVDSNLSELLGSYFSFQETHTLRNCSVALSLQNRVTKYLYASGVKYENCYVGASQDMAYNDPFSVSLFSTSKVDCISTGCQSSRVDKTKRISALSYAQKHLDVCVQPNRALGKINCSSCYKCLRTMLTLDVMDKLESFSEVFDLRKYENQKAEYVSQILVLDDAFAEEIQRLAKERSYKFPLKARILSCTPLNLARRIRNSLKRILLKIV